MALIFADGFDAYAASNLPQRYVSIINSPSLGAPGRLGYGQYLVCGNASGPTAALGVPNTTLTVGFAFYAATNALPSINTSVAGFAFVDSSNVPLCNVQPGPLGQLCFTVGTASSPTFVSATGLVFTQTWCYIEAQITFSSSGSGSVTLRLNGQTVLSQASVTTAANANGCSGLQFFGLNGATAYYDDFYVLNSTAPNNTFLGDIKILPLYPIGNGRISGFSRFGGSSAGNYTAVQEHPPDGDASYVYTATAGTSDAYTITTLSNVTTVKAVQVSAFARKDDTPSRVLALGVGNGTTENYDAGHSVNTTYTYVSRQLDVNPLTSAAWSPSDFTTLQLAQQLIS